MLRPLGTLFQKRFTLRASPPAVLIACILAIAAVATRRCVDKDEKNTLAIANRHNCHRHLCRRPCFSHWLPPFSVCFFVLLVFFCFSSPPLHNPSSKIHLLCFFLFAFIWPVVGSTPAQTKTKANPGALLRFKHDKQRRPSRHSSPRHIYFISPTSTFEAFILSESES